jgi:hypothetical protein
MKKKYSFKQKPLHLLSLLSLSLSHIAHGQPVNTNHDDLHLLVSEPKLRRRTVFTVTSIADPSKFHMQIFPATPIGSGNTLQAPTTWFSSIVTFHYMGSRARRCWICFADLEVEFVMS